jgi:hypothetical protein
MTFLSPRCEFAEAALQALGSVERDARESFTVAGDLE